VCAHRTVMEGHDCPARPVGDGAHGRVELHRQVLGQAGRQLAVPAKHHRVLAPKLVPVILRSRARAHTHEHVHIQTHAAVRSVRHLKVKVAGGGRVPGPTAGATRRAAARHWQTRGWQCASRPCVRAPPTAAACAAPTRDSGPGRSTGPARCPAPAPRLRRPCKHAQWVSVWAAQRHRHHHGRDCLCLWVYACMRVYVCVCLSLSARQHSNQ
jgi:hypothetical protein